MNRFVIAAVFGLVSILPAFAQYGGRDYGYEPRDRGYDREDRYRGRDRGYDDSDDDDRGYGRRGRGRGGFAFDEQEYLRCNPDVRRAVERGNMKSGAYHYQRFGRGENRRLTC